MPAGEAAELPGGAAAVRPGGRGAGRGRRRRRPTGSPTRSPSTWAAPPPTCAWSRTACRRRPPSGRWPATPVRLPSLDVHTIGAGGGSIARIDPGGALVVGPAERGRRSRARPATAAAATEPDRHRRRPGGRPHPVDGRVRRARRLDLDAAGGRPRRGGGDGRRRDRGGRRRRWSRPCGRCRSSAASTPGAWRWWPSAAPARCTPAPWPTRSGMPAVIVPARAGVLSAVGLLTAPTAARPRAVVADAGRPRRAGRGPRRRWRGEAAALVGRRPRRDRRRRRSTAATRGQSHELTGARRGRVPRRAPAPQRLRPARRPGRGRSRSGRRPRGPPRRSTPADLPDPPDRDRRPVAGPAVIAEPDCTIWVPDGWVGRAGRARARSVLRRSAAGDAP